MREIVILSALLVLVCLCPVAAVIVGIVVYLGDSWACRNGR